MDKPDFETKNPIIFTLNPLVVVLLAR